jgi:Uncharacterised nucleotidyltransferase
VSYSYRAYGVGIESTSRIAGLELSDPEETRFALRFETGPEPDWAKNARSLPGRILSHLPEDKNTADPAFVLTEHGNGKFYDLSYSNGARFVVDENAEHMWGATRPPLAPEDLAMYFLGPVMGFLLRHRHMTCLHASGVQLHDRAVLFCGDAGYGKSTTAAALALRGAPVLCEDIVPLEVTGGRYWAIPGYPRVCLWPDAVAKLVGDADAFPRLSPTWEKRYLPDPSLRRYVDMDLLVRHRDIAAATRQMLDMGFHADIPESAILAGKIPGEYLFRKPGTQRIVELHTEHTFRYYPKHMPLEDLFARSTTVLLDGREVPALSLEDELILTCVHGAKHFWERLIWVSDVAAVTARHPEIDWAKVHGAVAEVGAQRILHVGVQLASLVLKTPVPSAIAAEIRHDRACEPLCRQIQGWLPFAGAAPPSLPRRAMFRLKMAGGGLSGVAYLARLSLSPTQEDWAKGAEQQRSWFWQAVRRPFRLLRKYGQD